MRDGTPGITNHCHGGGVGAVESPERAQATATQGSFANAGTMFVAPGGFPAQECGRTGVFRCRLPRLFGLTSVAASAVSA